MRDKTWWISTFMVTTSITGGTGGLSQIDLKYPFNPYSSFCIVVLYINWYPMTTRKVYFLFIRVIPSPYTGVIYKYEAGPNSHNCVL